MFSLLVGLAGCNQVDESKAIGASVFRPEVGKVVYARSFADELGPRRHLAVAADGQTDGQLRDALASQATASGWSGTDCVTPEERCFRNGQHFLAMVGRGDAEDKPAYGGPAQRAASAEVLIIIAMDYSGQTPAS